MRGHVADRDEVMVVAENIDLTVVEDCAHTMGATWRGRPTGTFGAVDCFSTQSFKHVNAGEGGLLVTDDTDPAARATRAVLAARCDMRIPLSMFPAGSETIAAIIRDALAHSAP